MGSTLAKVAAAKNNVTLVGSPLDNDIINQLKKGQPHPGLRVDLPENITAVASTEIDDTTLRNADVIILGVSSPGVEWALNLIDRHQATPNILALVTKGLVSAASDQSAPLTYAQTLDPQLTLPAGRVVGIGGPCIARELALGYHTRVCFASHDIAVADQLRDILVTDYYHIATSDDFTGLEACAALKNFMCIGVSAMFTTCTLDDGYAKNPVAALFNQAVLEIDALSRWIKQDASLDDNGASAEAGAGRQALAFDLAGMGDLHVTVGGGRNSKLGHYLGTGKHLNDILQNDMKDVTVEGVGTARQLLPGFRRACSQGRLDAREFPLCSAILDVVENDQSFFIDFAALPR